MKRIAVFVLALMFILFIPGCGKNKDKDLLVGQWVQKNVSVMSGPSAFGDDWTSVDFYVYEFDENDNFRYIVYNYSNVILIWTTRTNEVTGKYSIKNGVITLNCSLEKVKEYSLASGELIDDHQNAEKWSKTLQYKIDTNTNQLIFEPDKDGNPRYDYYSVPVDSDELWMEMLRKRF